MLGLLAKYEADVKVQYMNLNSDLQYCVTVTRAKIKDAFISWDSLNQFIDGITESLYNGAYIDHYRMTKDLVTSAYAGNNVQIQTITAVTSEATAKAFVKEARKIYKNMRFPSSNYNAWNKVGGYGRALLTWSNPEDIVFLIKNSARAYLDVNVLASAFNIDKTTLMGNIYPVDNFDVYSDDGEKIFDGNSSGNTTEGKTANVSDDMISSGGSIIDILKKLKSKKRKSSPYFRSVFSSLPTVRLSTSLKRSFKLVELTQRPP